MAESRCSDDAIRNSLSSGHLGGLFGKMSNSISAKVLICRPQFCPSLEDCDLGADCKS